MEEARITAECWPVGSYLLEEMQERGWSSHDVAERIGGSKKDVEIWELTVDLLVYCSDEPGVLVGQSTADALSRVFGTSPEFFINLNSNYQRWQASKHMQSRLQTPTQ